MTLKRHKTTSGMVKRKKAPTLAKLKKTAWDLLSLCVRKEAADGNGWVRCYTCGAVHQWNNGIQAGHAIQGRTGATLLDEEIIRPQDYACNIGLGGNYSVFTTKLIGEKAESLANGNPIYHATLNAGFSPIYRAWEWWEAKLSESRQVKKWDRISLQAKIDEYRERLARLS